MKTFTIEKNDAGQRFDKFIVDRRDALGHEQTAVFGKSLLDDFNPPDFTFLTLERTANVLEYLRISILQITFVKGPQLFERIKLLDDIRRILSDVHGELLHIPLEEMLPKLPTITFFSQFIYCWLFGTVVAAIFSRNIPSSNPFDNIDEQ